MPTPTATPGSPSQPLGTTLTNNPITTAASGAVNNIHSGSAAALAAAHRAAGALKRRGPADLRPGCGRGWQPGGRAAGELRAQSGAVAAAAELPHALAARPGSARRAPSCSATRSWWRRATTLWQSLGSSGDGLRGRAAAAEPVGSAGRWLASCATASGATAASSRRAGQSDPEFALHHGAASQRARRSIWRPRRRRHASGDCARSQRLAAANCATARAAIVQPRLWRRARVCACLSRASARCASGRLCRASRTNWKTRSRFVNGEHIGGKRNRLRPEGNSIDKSWGGYKHQQSKVGPQ